MDETKLPVAVRVRIEFLRDKTQSENRSRSSSEEALPSVQSTIALMSIPQIEEEEADGESPEDDI